MKNLINIAIVAIGSVSCGLFGFFLTKIIIGRIQVNKQKTFLKGSAGIDNQGILRSFTCDGIASKVLVYMFKCSYTILHVNKDFCISKSFVRSSNLPKKTKQLIEKANFPIAFNNKVYREVQLRLSLLFLLIGALIGAMFSSVLMLILAIIGLLLGFSIQRWALKQEVEARTIDLEKNLPEMLEVVALGLRSGLTFDRSLKIYTSHFNNEFSKSCCFAQQKWEGGLSSRENSLRSLADSYDSQLFNRIIENIIRSLRFGSSLVEGLEEASLEARNSYKTKQEEKVAKAPVKMMIPTGTLILPAMLILVLGPVLLELINGF